MSMYVHMSICVCVYVSVYLGVCACVCVYVSGHMCAIACVWRRSDKFWGWFPSQALYPLSLHTESDFLPVCSLRASRLCSTEEGNNIPTPIFLSSTQTSERCLHILLGIFQASLGRQGVQLTFIFPSGIFPLLTEGSCEVHQLHAKALHLCEYPMGSCLDTAVGCNHWVSDFYSQVCFGQVAPQLLCLQVFLVLS